VPRREHTSKMLRYGMHSQAISQFYLFVVKRTSEAKVKQFKEWRTDCSVLSRLKPFVPSSSAWHRQHPAVSRNWKCACKLHCDAVRVVGFQSDEFCHN